MHISKLPTSFTDARNTILTLGQAADPFRFTWLEYELTEAVEESELLANEVYAQSTTDRYHLCLAWCHPASPDIDHTALATELNRIWLERLRDRTGPGAHRIGSEGDRLVLEGISADQHGRYITLRLVVEPAPV